MPEATAHPVLVIGAGISGLACAYELRRAGIPVRVLEATGHAGGVIGTREKNGLRFELGPQSFLSTEPLLKLVDALGLKDQLLNANPRAPRYILLLGRLVAAPLAPPSLLSTPLFSAGTKLRLVTEMLRRSTPPVGDESIAAFVRRKFGSDLLERLVAPFVSGVYAGDPERLSLRAAFPKVHEFESQYGSVLRGAMKSRPAKGTPRPGLCSFRDGMESLPRALGAYLAESLVLDANVAALRHGKANGKPWFEIDVVRNQQKEMLAATTVVIATPTGAASQILQPLSDKLSSLLAKIEYAPIAVISACYRLDQLHRPPNGFGFLVPRQEELHLLGTVFSSALFPGRAPEGMTCVTSFAGGATEPDFCRLSDSEIKETIAAEVAQILGIKGKPAAENLFRHERAIPQYNLGHTDIVKSLEALTAGTPGLFLAGNYLSGPAIGACVEQANRTAESVRRYLASIGVTNLGAVAHA